MLPRRSLGPTAIAAALLVALSALPGGALGPSGAISFIAGALASAHINKRHAPRGSYVYLWLLAGILAEAVGAPRELNVVLGYGIYVA